MDGAPGAISGYDCNVKFIPGHNPDLVLRDPDTGQEFERVDLTKYKSEPEIKSLFDNKGVAHTTLKAEL